MKPLTFETFAKRHASNYHRIMAKRHMAIACLKDAILSLEQHAPPEDTLEVIQDADRWMTHYHTDNRELVNAYHEHVTWMERVKDHIDPTVGR